MNNKTFYKNFNFKEAAKFINTAIKEDIGNGDVTSELLIPRNSISIANLMLKERGVIAGLEIFKLVFKLIDPKIRIETKCPEGVFFNCCARIAEISGNTKNILKAERLSLNILQRMSGVATATYLLKTKISNKKIKLVDTRKTTPNMRILEKLAVKIGGGDNHRFGLYDMILIKDNHIEANNGIENTLRILRKKFKNKELKIEIEVKDINEFLTVQNLGKNLVNIVMLDNFKIDDIKKAAKLNKNKFKLEISGGVNHRNIVDYGKIKGIDIISVGALTHSVRSIDLSLDFVS